jgi:glycosyltransferase involved in cell wall biosynthesis
MTKDEFELSVVIPTYNRSAVTARCLDALTKQTLFPDAYEIIVSDDGSPDDTQQVTESFAGKGEHHIRYLYQPNRGANAARNNAIRQARGRLLLFINDDTIAAPRMLEEHCRMHGAHTGEQVSVLGKVTYAPGLPPNLFARLHLDADYGLWEGKESLDWRAFYTCNVSVKKAFLEKYGVFEEGIRYHEDVELSERLRHHGLEVLYAPEALGYHYHVMTEKEYLGVAVREGTAIALWYKKSPHLKEELAQLGFHPTAPALRRMKLICGDAVFNRGVQPLWLACARLLARCNEAAACAIYRKIFQAIKRESVRRELSR